MTAFGRVLSKLASGELGALRAPARVSGLMGPARSMVAALLAERTGAPVVIVVPDERRLAPAIADLECFLGALGSEKRVLPFPAFALDPYRGLRPHLEVTSGRALALAALAASEPVVVVTTGAGLLYRTSRPERLRAGIKRLVSGENVPPTDLERHLAGHGYRYEDPVTTPGDFARRGGILDVFPPGRKEPLRLEFLGDEIEEIRVFDVGTQRTTGSADEAVITPATEWPATEVHLAELEIEDLVANGAAGFALVRHPDFQATIFDYLGKGVLIVEEPDEILRAAEQEWERLLASYSEADEEAARRYAPPAALLLDLGALEEELGKSAIALREMGLLGEETHHLSTGLLPSYRHRLPELLNELKRRVAAGDKIWMFVSGEGMIDRSVEILAEAGLTAGRAREDEAHEGHVVLELGHLSASFTFADLGLAVVSASDVFAEPVREAPRRGVKLRRFLSDFRDLKVGDYVVHTEHGVGIFSGLKELEAGATTEFVVVEYQGRDRLYVPVDKLDFLEKYSSAEASAPRVDKLGGTGWGRVKKRVKKSMRDMAEELLKLYAARRASPGYAFSPDTAWIKEFEGLFEFEETPDQLQAIADVKRDMEAPSPMDRLICGDVGYGKTEVAMRAAFKAVLDGKQVAVLVPTTVLAFQHQTTFGERFAPFPVRVEMLSRFRTKKEQKRIVEDVAAGKVDILIGTHRMLSKDVSFQDLGLLIVDEEQRFGVAHKERLKKLRQGVDVLTLTATPIPRTLHMSLSGIRDLSVIETPPKDRMAIQTHITPLDAKVLTEAIRYELGRGGQVYFVHNRVSSIYSLASFLHRLVPEARIVVAHGQMKESELEKVMLRFVRHEVDVLVSTTIIENGLDIPLVNTLIVNRADRFGLSQLYQLRGRVGRSDRRAYAYLLVPEEARLTPIARRRLAAIREFSELGAGFRIAALDLELRGAGNLLGGEQHGHIEAVGFDLYCRLLDETVRELEGEDVAAASGRASLSLRIELRLPEAFVPDTSQRMSIYKRASSARDREELDRLQEETRDRFGPLPESALQFFEYARLQILASGLGLRSIDREKGGLAFELTELTELTALTALTAEKLAALVAELPGARLRPRPDGVSLWVELPGTETAEILTTVREVLLPLARYARAKRSVARG